MTVNPSVSLALDSSPYTGEPLVHRIIKNTTAGGPGSARLRRIPSKNDTYAPLLGWFFP